MKSLKGINFLLIFGAIIIFIAPLIHIEFSKKNELVENYKSKLKNTLIAPFDLKISQNEKAYTQKKISAETYISNSKSLQKEVLKVKKQYTTLIRKKQDENRIFGWLTLRKFLNGFGIRLPYLIFSLIISYLIGLVKTENNNLKKSFFFLQITCYTITGYVIIWCFWYLQDYSISSYRVTILILSALVSTAGYYLIKYKNELNHNINRKLDSLKGFIRVLFDVILVETKEKDLIKDEYKEEFDTRKKELISQAIEIENNLNLKKKTESSSENIEIEISEMISEASKLEAKQLFNDIDKIHLAIDKKALNDKKDKLRNKS